MFVLDSFPAFWNFTGTYHEQTQPGIGMVNPSMAQATLSALKQRIAAIESPPEAGAARLVTGAAGFDHALGGGIECAALCEVRTGESRNAGAAAGFVLAMASIAMRDFAAPLLWVSTSANFRETGFPHAGGLRQEFAISPESLLFAETHKPLDALWIGAEAAGLARLVAVVIELAGNPACLDLVATQRLQRSARASGRPVFLLRLAANSQPTAAPLRLGIGPAPATPRKIFGQPLAGTIDRPAFLVSLEKCRANPGRQFILEWNCNERRLDGCRRQATDPVALVPASFNRSDPAPPLRAGMAAGSTIRGKTG